MGEHHEHHFKPLGRACDALVNVMQSLDSALELMAHEDWLDGAELRELIWNDVAPRLQALRNRASERFDEHTRLPDFQRMRAGELRFPDERALPDEPAVEPRPVPANTAPPLNGPSAKIGAALVARYGSVDAAMLAAPPGGSDMGHINAYVYVSTGKRPVGWIPPVVGTEDA